MDTNFDFNKTEKFDFDQVGKRMPYSTPDDFFKDMEAMKENPQNGFRMMMAKYQENVYWHIRRLVVSHDDAQDASQETFVRI